MRVKGNEGHQETKPFNDTCKYELPESVEACTGPAHCGSSPYGVQELERELDTSPSLPQKQMPIDCHWQMKI